MRTPPSLRSPLLRLLNRHRPLNRPRLPILAACLCAAALMFPARGVCAQNDAPTAPIALFNGKDLSGWFAQGKDNSPDAAKTWAAANGVITGTGKPFGYLRTEKSYSNYRLHVEWRWLAAPLDDTGKPRKRNSGVFLHMQGPDQVWPACVEAQLEEQNAGDFILTGVDCDELKAARAAALAAAGDNQAAQKKAANLRLLRKKNPPSEKPAGEWNSYDIVCDAGSITVSVNGVEQNRVTGLTTTAGRVCLQAEGAPVEFRNITLTPLAATAAPNTLTAQEQAAGWRLLFDGSTLKGWHNFKSPSVRPGWQVRDGALVCADPKNAGDIVTDGDYDSFELQLDYNITPAGNSGIMYHVTTEGRAVWSTGPEFQLEDNELAADPQRCGWLYALYQPPADPATGKPLDATKPVGQWNHVRLLVTPEKCVHEINGVKYFEYVLGSDDFNKRVAASKFSRMPLFAKSQRGSIALQGDHGQVSFRNIKIRPIPPAAAAP